MKKPQCTKNQMIAGMDYSGDCRAKPSVGDVAVMAALHHSMTFQKSLFHFTLQAPNQFNLFTCSYITQIGDLNPRRQKVFLLPMKCLVVPFQCPAKTYMS
ncbi:hypothetical protein ACOSQ4_023570 [Xanthoceras sorbifolium]